MPDHLLITGCISTHKHYTEATSQALTDFFVENGIRHVPLRTELGLHTDLITWSLACVSPKQFDALGPLIRAAHPRVLRSSGQVWSSLSPAEQARYGSVSCLPEISVAMITNDHATAARMWAYWSGQR